jgi:hypothetical protein
MPREGKLSPKIVFHDRHNHREIDNLIREESLRTRTIAVNRNTGREYHLIIEHKPTKKK